MYHTNYLIFSVKSFQKGFLWSSVVTALCCMRAANNFTVLLAFVVILARGLQGGSLTVQKYGLAKVGYLVATGCIIMMWFSEFAKESADIIHEAAPTEEILQNAEFFSNN